ncbi:MAG: proton-conducting transporter membrane subunit [Candidatus Izemoplasma sp.]
MSAVLLIAIPLIAAFISILNKKTAPYILLGVTLFNILSLPFYDLGQITIGGFEAPYGISLILDSYSILALYVVNIAFLIVIVTSTDKVKKVATVLLVALAGLNGLLLTGDLFNLFVFIEVSGIAAYLISTTNKKYLETFNYLVIGVVGSSLYLLGLIILYAMTGTLNMVDVGVQITALNISATDLAFPFLLMFIGLGVEAKLLPFNAWVKGILGNSNKLVGPMIASVYAGAIGFVFGRVISSVFVISDELEIILSVILIVGIIAGEAMAFASSKMREVLLYSSIAQASLVIMLFVVGVTGWATMMLVANVVTKFILFAIATHTSDELKTDELDDLEGIFINNKVIGVSFTIAALSISGLPLFFGFVVKMNMLTDVFAGDGRLFAAVILITSVVEGVYFVRMLIKLWYTEKDTTPTINYSFKLKYIVVVLAALLIVFGVYTTPVEDYVEDELYPLLVEEGGINNEYC